MKKNLFDEFQLVARSVLAAAVHTGLIELQNPKLVFDPIEIILEQNFRKRMSFRSSGSIQSLDQLL